MQWFVGLNVLLPVANNLMLQCHVAQIYVRAIGTRMHPIISTLITGSSVRPAGMPNYLIDDLDFRAADHLWASLDDDRASLQ